MSSAGSAVLGGSRGILEDFEALVERLGRHREMRTHIVLSTQYERPTVQRPLSQPREVSPAAGWTCSSAPHRPMEPPRPDQPLPDAAPPQPAPTT